MNAMKREATRLQATMLLPLAALAGSVLLAGCEVTNPGPVRDDFLAEPASQQGLVNGSIRALAELIAGDGGGVAYTGAIISRELFPGGQTGNHGHDVPVQGGYVTPGSFEDYFDDGQQARFVAEEAVRRFTEVGAPEAMLYQAHLYAGYAYRVLGEHWCEAVIDGSGLQPGSTYFERGEASFTSAIALAPDEASRLAAVAGRAQVRLWLGDFAGAASDASEVPDDFRFDLEYDDIDTATRNAIWFANANLPYRAYVVLNTFQHDYYLETGDPRTRWFEDPAIEFANASLQGFGQVPWSNQAKYTGPDADVRLAGGPEMRLIEAETLLVEGRWQEALARINAVRTANLSDLTGAPLEPWTAGSAEEVGTRLKRERAIELWLEGRHWGDQRRWADQGTPGSFQLPDFESASNLFTLNPRSECLDIPDSERDTNPNVPSRGS